MPRERGAAQTVNAVLKRTFDIVAAATALLVLFPVMLLVAAAIRAETPGPIIFAQRRLGQHGRPFRLFKFRKFPDGPAEQGSAVTLHEDARLTRVGRLLQRSKLDELPQLWNVLIGDMSLIGPRPESPRFRDCFRDEYLGVLRYQPGLLGPSQVLFRNESALFPKNLDPESYYRETLFPVKACLDLAYHAEANVVRDLQWLLRGAVVILFPSMSGSRSDDVLTAAEKWMARRNPGDTNTRPERRGRRRKRTQRRPPARFPRNPPLRNQRHCSSTEPDAETRGAVRHMKAEE
jgi:lipopolysaccharide/colanic/teichoic acid biosynthesis glycosyltransferase